MLVSSQGVNLAGEQVADKYEMIEVVEVGEIGEVVASIVIDLDGRLLLE